MEQPDFERARREQLRWSIMLTLNAARPLGASDVLVLTATRAAINGITIHHVRTELDYLAMRELVEIERGDHMPTWAAKLTRAGVDVVEYTVPCDPGIARPSPYYVTPNATQK